MPVVHGEGRAKVTRSPRDGKLHGGVDINLSVVHSERAMMVTEFPRRETQRIIEPYNMLRPGIYRSRTPSLTIEEHGGGQLEHYIFWYVCFYLPKLNVGMYGTSSPKFVQPYVQSTIELQGEITLLTERHISFYIYNTARSQNINFTGRIENNNLYLTYHHEDKPNELFEDVLEYLWDGLGPL